MPLYFVFPHNCLQGLFGDCFLWIKKKNCLGAWRGEVSTAEGLVTASGAILATGSCTKAWPGL